MSINAILDGNTANLYLLNTSGLCHSCNLISLHPTGSVLDALDLATGEKLSNLSTAHLGYSDLSVMNLSKVDFTSASLIGATLTGAIRENCTIKEVKFIGNSEITSCRFANTKINGGSVTENMFKDIITTCSSICEVANNKNTFQVGLLKKGASI